MATNSEGQMDADKETHLSTALGSLCEEVHEGSLEEQASPGLREHHSEETPARREHHFPQVS